jgi:hypothetical protein
VSANPLSCEGIPTDWQDQQGYVHCPQDLPQSFLLQWVKQLVICSPQKESMLHNEGLQLVWKNMRELNEIKLDGFD